MDLYALFVVLHLILFAYWLGGDIGVFYSSGYLLKPELSPATRATVVKIFSWIDMAPRICLILMVPSGMTLASMLGLVSLSMPLLLAIWAFGLVWLALVLAQHNLHGKGPAKIITRVDYWIRIALVIVLGAVSVAGLFGVGLITDGWLALKLLLFVAMIGCGLMIRVIFKPFGPAFAQLMSTGSTPEVEATMAKALNTAKPFVVAIWVGLVINAYLGVAKPF